VKANSPPPFHRWLLASELSVDASQRSRAVRVSATSHWAGSLIVTASAPALYATLGPLCLLPAVAVALLALSLLPYVLPETRGFGASRNTLAQGGRAGGESEEDTDDELSQILAAA